MEKEYKFLIMQEQKCFGGARNEEHLQQIAESLNGEIVTKSDGRQILLAGGNHYNVVEVS